MKSAAFQRPGRILLALIAVLGVLAALAVGGWYPADHPEPGPAINVEKRRAGGKRGSLVVAIYPSPVFAPGIMSNGGLEPDPQAAYAGRHGIRVHFILEEDWNAAMKGLAQGEYDVIWGTPDMLASTYPRMRGINPSAFLLAGWSCGLHAVAASSRVRSAADLAGKTVACAKDSPSHFLALYLLDLNGIKPASLRWKFTMTDADAADLFRKKRTDLLAAGIAHVQDCIKKRGDASLFLSTSAASRLLADIFITREDTIIVRREELASFAAGWMDGVTASLAKPDEGAIALDRAFRVHNGTPGKVLEEVSLAGYRENASFFGMEAAAPPDFTFLYTTAARLHGGTAEETAPVSALARSIHVLSAIQKKYSSMQRTPWRFLSTPSRGIRAVTAPLALAFPLNGVTPEMSSHTALRGMCLTASVFPQSFIAITVYVNPAEDRWLNLTGKRAQEIIDSISSNISIPRERFIVSELPAPGSALRKGAEVSIALPADGNVR